MRNGGSTLVLVCLGALLCLAASDAHPRPFDNPSGKRPVTRGYYQLRAARDATLQQALEAQLDAPQLHAAVEDHRLAVALVDITELERPRLAMVNGDAMLYAASLPKIAILLGAFERAREGRLALDGPLHEQVTAMIRVSSNGAASAVLQRVGQRYLLQLLQSGRYKLYDKHYNGGLWVGRSYGGGGMAQRDPLHNLSHGATAYQVARFYYLLATGRLVSTSGSARMKEVLGRPGIRHKFVAGLLQSHPDAQLYRKSGSWRSFHADSALVERADRRYIAVALADDARGELWLQQLILALDMIVFAHPGTPPSQLRWCLSRYVCRLPYRYPDDAPLASYRERYQAHLSRSQG